MELKGYITAKTSNNLSVFGKGEKICGGAIGDGVILDDRGVYVTVPKDEYEKLETASKSTKTSKKASEANESEANNG